MKDVVLEEPDAEADDKGHGEYGPDCVPSAGHRIAVSVGYLPITVLAAVDLSGSQDVASRLPVD